MITKKPHYYLGMDGTGDFEKIKKNAGTQQEVSDTNTSGNTVPKVETPNTGNAGTSNGGTVSTGGTSYDPVKQALDLLNQHNAAKPGQWADPYEDQYMGYLNQYINRGPFSYNMNDDALYNQLKDQYIQMGQMASMDAMGQAAAMTGGYGNSYAQSVGQQAYNQYLGQLNSIMPDLYSAEYDRYEQEGADLLNKYSLYKGLSEESYTKYQNEFNNWYNEYEQLADNYNDLTAEPTYNELLAGSDAYGYIDKEIRGATSIEGLKAVLKKYASMKYDPDVLEQMASEKLKELS